MDQNIVSWNRVREWLSRLDAVWRAASRQRQGCVVNRHATQISCTSASNDEPTRVDLGKSSRFATPDLREFGDRVASMRTLRLPE